MRKAKMYRTINKIVDISLEKHKKTNIIHKETAYQHVHTYTHMLIHTLP